MRRLLTIVFVVSAALCTVCSAATLKGRQADYKMTMTINAEAFAKALQAGGPQLPKGQQMPKITIPPIVTSGKMIWSGTQSRTETKDAKGQLVSISLMDMTSKVIYSLMPQTKTALRMTPDANSAVGAALGAAGGRGPSGLQQGYDAILQQFRSADGATVKELGKKKVGNLDCRGIGFTQDMSKLKNALATQATGNGHGAQMQEMMNSMLGMQGKVTGEVWISDKYGAAVKTIAKLNGTSMVMECSNFQDWSGPDSTFAVPAGYTVKDVSSLATAAHPPAHPPVHAAPAHQ